MLVLVTPGIVTSYAVATRSTNTPPAIAQTVRLADHPFCVMHSFIRHRIGPLVSMDWSAEVGLQLPISALSDGITAAIEAAATEEMKNLEAGKAVDLRALELDEEELSGHKQRLLAELGDIDAAGIVFTSNGTPALGTTGLALVLTARSAAELDFPSMTALESGALEAHAMRARLALSTVAETALSEVQEAMNSDNVSAEDAKSNHRCWATLELTQAYLAGETAEDWGIAPEDWGQAKGGE
jgi:hypothetical protein